MIAKDLLGLLAQKHWEDVFVPECKDGPTQQGSHFRLDAWVMKKSWSNPAVFGYEIKVSRGDFLQDTKWPAYLPMCNQLYFVCPTGLIDPSETPAEVGLLWSSKNGSRLYVKKKASHRAITIPEDVWRYILMCRVKITREHGSEKRLTREFWEGWLVDKKLDRDFGWAVGGALAKRVNEEIVAAQAKSKELDALVHKYEDIRKYLQELGIHPDSEWQVTRERVQAKLEKARSVIPDGLLYQLQNLAGVAERVRESLAELDGESSTV
jgi:hypothetical protein